MKAKIMVEDKGDDGKQHTNICQQHSDPNLETEIHTRDKGKTRRFKDESRLDGQHSHMGTHQLSKEQRWKGVH